MSKETDRPQAVATIGVFDGVHRGHLALLRAVREQAGAVGALAVAVTFDPPPQAILAPSAEAFEITPWAPKRALLDAAGIDRLLLVRFSAETASLGPRAFLTEVILAAFDLRRLVVGYDFRFGAGGVGDVAGLRVLGGEHGFGVTEVEAVRVGDQVVSSTLIRELLRRGAVEEAAGMLGRPFAITAPVGSGRGLGSKVLVPTANLIPEATQLLPAEGVYLTEVEWEGSPHPAIAMVGASPTLTTGSGRLIEVHLLGFSGDLRHRELTVRFLERMRGGRRFSGLAELGEAIGRDIDWARRRFAERAAGTLGGGGASVPGGGAAGAPDGGAQAGDAGGRTGHAGLSAGGENRLAGRPDRC
ncbi:MAG: riboflavin biosynthesis protein RibF [Candidatus Eisenbacteria sp.]|nr:riboflavin biosynthesis protein RibF [Candidatus Eisenbacteria bacterium]